jgi:hypothetical protein
MSNVVVHSYRSMKYAPHAGLRPPSGFTVLVSFDRPSSKIMSLAAMRASSGRRSSYVFAKFAYRRASKTWVLLFSSRISRLCFSFCWASQEQAGAWPRGRKVLLCRRCEEVELLLLLYRGSGTIKCLPRSHKPNVRWERDHLRYSCVDNNPSQ